MKILADLHTHTVASRHAYSTFKENVEQALLTNLEYLGISDHTPGMATTTCEGYFNNLKVIRKNINGLNILKGAESNIMDVRGQIDLHPEVMARLDYVIASLHSLVIDDMGIIANTEAIIKAMENPYVKIIGHPDDDYFPLDFKTLVLAAKSSGVALELNNASLSPRSSRTGGYLNARKLLEQCALAGAPVMVGSDSHIWYDVGKFDYALSLMGQVSFPPNLVINSDLKQFETFMKFSDTREDASAVA